MFFDDSRFGLKAVLLFVLLILISSVFVSGCVECSFGTPQYLDNNLVIPIDNTGSDTVAVVQATIYSLADFRQVEYVTLVKEVELKSGQNEYSLPVKLPDGNYKLYLYVLNDGKRLTAQIRDITVGAGQ